MSIHDDGFSVLLPDAQHWRDSNIMRLPNANLVNDLEGATASEDACGVFRLTPRIHGTSMSISWELYFLLEGLGRMRVGKTTITGPPYDCVLVAPQMLRKVFNDTSDESL